jgi:hypothetical protein
MKNFPTLIRDGCAEAYKKVSKNWLITINIREDMTNCAEELRQHIRNAVASLTIEEIRNIPM